MLLWILFLFVVFKDQEDVRMFFYVVSPRKGDSSGKKVIVFLNKLLSIWSVYVISRLGWRFDRQFSGHKSDIVSRKSQKFKENLNSTAQ